MPVMNSVPGVLENIQTRPASLSLRASMALTMGCVRVSEQRLLSFFLEALNRLCLAFLLALRAPLGFAASGAGFLVFSLSIALSFIEFLLDRVAVVTVITPTGRNIKTNLAATTPMRRNSIMVKGNWRVRVLFYIPDKTRQRLEGVMRFSGPAFRNTHKLLNLAIFSTACRAESTIVSYPIERTGVD
jgi:hypothetical protein